MIVQDDRQEPDVFEMFSTQLLFTEHLNSIYTNACNSLPLEINYHLKALNYYLLNI